MADQPAHLVRPVHVWVDLTGSWMSPSPGVLVEWRQDRRGGWEGWVIRVDTYPTGGEMAAQVVQSWVPGHLLRRAETVSPPLDVSGYRPAGAVGDRA